MPSELEINCCFICHKVIAQRKKNKGKLKQGEKKKETKAEIGTQVRPEAQDSHKYS